MFVHPSSAQPLFGTACPDAQELLELNDLLFSTGFICTPLDQAFHAAYDRWESPTGPAPFRSVPAGVAVTIQRLADAGNRDGAELQLLQMPPSPMRTVVANALTQSNAGTVEALFLTDDLEGRAFRLGNGFDWEGARALMEEILSPAAETDTQSPPDPAAMTSQSQDRGLSQSQDRGEGEDQDHGAGAAQRAFRYIVLGAVLGANEREAEPGQSIGWTRLPLWPEAQQNPEQALAPILKDLERAVANWGKRSVLYLRLGARQLGVAALNDDLYADYFNDACRPLPDWPTAARHSLAQVLALDKNCADVANLALRDWEGALAEGLPIPAWVPQ